MAWTNLQKQLAVRACRAAGIGEAHRRLILHNISHARLPDGRVSSTAPKLTNADFEAFMSVVERAAGGKLLHFTENYWQTCAADALGRMRHKARAIAAELEAAGRLAPGGAGLAGWLRKRVARGQTDRLEDLDYQGLRALIVGLAAFARQRAEPAPA